MDLPPNHSIPVSPQDFLTNLSHGGQGGVDNGGLSELLSQQSIEEDENSEWLSVFVEDCLSSPGNYGLASASDQMITKSSNQNPPKPLKPQLQNLSPLENFQSSDKPTRIRKKKRKSVMKLKAHKTASFFGLDYFDWSPELEPDPDPPLLQQSHWLADSELIFPITQNSPAQEQSSIEEKGIDISVSLSPEPYIESQPYLEKKKVSKSRRCTHCQADKTPLWRQGPLGKGTLCNACGVRWLKTGTLFPEYRPANSPTFVSNLHSNILRKVLKMREARQPSCASEE